ncbi:hypothetical protein Tco_0625167 [Tanacetum coccineum]|uniref:Uncharacterized protein n=1 Tax=Tanacetum coccineum TaxID=301880 RepID=A0ABQ4WG52_9ASTR
MEFDDEEYDDLYKDVNVRSKVTEHKEVGKGDVKMTDATHENVPVTAIPETSTVPATTVPPVIQHQQSTPTPEPTIEPSTTLIPALPDFSSLFGFDHRVSTLETELSQLKQE